MTRVLTPKKMGVVGGGSKHVAIITPPRFGAKEGNGNYNRTMFAKLGKGRVGPLNLPG